MARLEPLDLMPHPQRLWAVTLRVTMRPSTLSPHFHRMNHLLWRRLLLTCACVALLLHSLGSRAADLPTLDTVVDQAEVLSVEAKADLRAKLASFERDHQLAMVVVLMPSTAPDTVEERARQLANAWQIGRSFQGRGMLLLVAVKDRRYRLEVSNALADALTDEEAKNLLAEHLRPGLRAGNADLAVGQLLDALAAHFTARHTEMVVSTAEASSAVAKDEVAGEDAESAKTRSYAIWIILGTMVVGLILVGLAIWACVALARWLIARTGRKPQPWMAWGGGAAILSVTAIATGWIPLLGVVLTMVLMATTWFGMRALISMVTNGQASSSDDDSSFGSSTRTGGSVSSGSTSSSSDDSGSGGSSDYDGRGASDSY
ncbi:MAG: hypothetical protein C4K60_15830 [Ideonella sp. MAG2]|nr:MAG: hypothetical protein C4K60_15830 [Ideonella sp. MAG2]